MPSDEIAIISRNCTPFTPDGRVDEDALRLHLEKFMRSGIDVYLVSGGSGEANSLTRDEVRQVYRVGVRTAKGTVTVNANLPEVRTAAQAIDFARVAIDEGVDLVNFYGPASLHNFIPRENELRAYFHTVLSAVQFPVALAPNPAQGYTPSPALMAELANSYPYVVAIHLVGISGDSYFLELRRRLTRDIALNVPLPGSLQLFELGATGLICNLANLIPRTVRRYVDLYRAGDLGQMSAVYAELQALARYVEQPKWRGARWQKMALKVFKLPGGEGGLREPYLMPPDDEIAGFTAGLLSLGLAEVAELAQAAGIDPRPRG